MDSILSTLLHLSYGGEAGFGEALVANGGIAVGEEFADFGAVFGEEGGDVVEIFYVHKCCHGYSNFSNGERSYSSSGSLHLVC